jgi:hypothetical protein
MQWILSGCSVIMLWLMGNKNKYAPMIGIATQLLWIYYCISTRQYGLLAGVIVYTVVHIRNAVMWLR